MDFPFRKIGKSAPPRGCTSFLNPSLNGLKTGLLLSLKNQMERTPEGRSDVVLMCYAGHGGMSRTPVRSLFNEKSEN